MHIAFQKKKKVGDALQDRSLQHRYKRDYTAKLTHPVKLLLRIELRCKIVLDTMFSYNVLRI